LVAPCPANPLERRATGAYLDLGKETHMTPVWRLGLAAVFVMEAAAFAQAAGRPGADPDWPCHQNKVAEFPLASVWDGPPIDTAGAAWRDDPVVAALATQMSQRRVPIAEVQAAVGKLLASAGPEAKARLLQAFGAAFDELTRQRSEIITGLDRFGRKQRELADRIRAENETTNRDQTPWVATPDESLQKLQWDLRLFDDRRRTVAYVCEAPQLVESRIGELVKIVRAAL
jgi:hypothetical protein